MRLAQEFRNFDFLSPGRAPDYPLPGDEKAAVDDNRDATIRIRYAMPGPYDEFDQAHA